MIREQVDPRIPQAGAPALSPLQAQLLQLATTPEGMCLVDTANRLATRPETLLDEIRYIHRFHGFGYIKLDSGNFRLLPYPPLPAGALPAATAACFSPLRLIAVGNTPHTSEVPLRQQFRRYINV